MTGDTERCDVDGCRSPAISRVLPTHGRTDHYALRCRGCLLYDLKRDWFREWKGKIMLRSVWPDTDGSGVDT